MKLFQAILRLLPVLYFKYQTIFKVTLRGESSHNGSIFDVHMFKNLLCQRPIASQLIGQPVVMKLPGVGSKIKNMVLRSLPKATMASRKHSLQNYWLVLRENGSNDIST